MIRYRFKPRLASLVTLVVGLLLLAATVAAILLLLFSDGENRRTVGRVWVLVPVMGVAGLLAVGLAVRAAFRKVCAECGEPVAPQSEMVFAAADFATVVRLLRADDWSALRAVVPLKLQKPFTTDMLPGTLVVQTNVCVGCGHAGSIRAYKAGASVADASTILERRDAPGTELKSLAEVHAA